LGVYFTLSRLKRSFKPSKSIIAWPLGYHGHENKQNYKIFQLKQEQSRPSSKSKS
jgi:hypothetical protein